MFSVLLKCVPLMRVEGACLEVVRWRCGYAGTRVGEASHPGPAVAREDFEAAIRRQRQQAREIAGLLRRNTQGRNATQRALLTELFNEAEATTGKRSKNTGMLCDSIGAAYYNQQRHAEAVPWFERAVAAYTFSYGAENEQRTKAAVQRLERAKGPPALAI